MINVGGSAVKKSINEIRNEKGITQSYIAEELGIAVSTYNMYEKGKRKVPEKIASGIARILEIERDDVFLPATFAISKTIESCSKSSCFDNGNICCRYCKKTKCSFKCNDVRNRDCEYRY
jgi:putative transcriptional regulator